MAQQRRRPVGWWLKEADRRLDDAFERALQGPEVDRRGWQVLATLAGGPTTPSGLAGSLASFDSSAVVGDVVARLRAQGWVEESGGLLRLTRDGEREHATLAPLVEGVRQQVAAALPPDDYVALVGLLERLVASLDVAGEAGSPSA